MTEIQIHSETFRVLRYRRNYTRCRDCKEQTGTLIFRAETTREETTVLAVCEKCGRRWIPTLEKVLRGLAV
jgi:hypothetical protein